MKNKFQVVVLGGSLSALSFALKSAERGFSTLLIEENNNLGGEYSGKYNGSDYYNIYKRNLTKNFSFNSNILFQNYYYEKFEELNVSILLNTAIYKIRTTNNKIDHLIISDGQSQYVVELYLLVDCSANLFSLKILNNNQFGKNEFYNTVVIRFAGIDFVEALADVRENPQNYSADTSKRYSENDIIKLSGYKNVVDGFKEKNIVSDKFENLEFIFPIGIDETMLTLTLKNKLSKKEVDFIINQLKNNCVGFKNIYATEIKNIEMEYINPIYLTGIENKPENLLLQNNILNETEKLNPLSIETQSKLLDFGVNISQNIESILKK